MNENNNDLTRKKNKKTILSTSILETSKIPPQEISLEEAILGAIMLEKDSLTSVIDLLHSQVFYKDAHQKIFDSIMDLFNKNEPIDILTVTNQLRKNGELDMVGGPYYITQLTSRVASSANIEYHTRIILQKYMQRELIRISSDVIRDSFEDTSDVFDVLEYAEKNLFQISENSSRGTNKKLNECIKDTLDRIKIACKKDGTLIGVPSGFTEIDRMTGGWQNSNLILFAARPGMGKTSFALSNAVNCIKNFNKKVAFFSMEMSTIEITQRIISMECDISIKDMRNGDIQDYHWEQIHAKIMPISESNLYIDDTPSLSVFELRARTRRMVQKYGIEIIFIDYVQLMNGGNEQRKNGNRTNEMDFIARSLKSIAKELNIPVIALSQLSREVEKRGGSKRPINSDLRESGEFEQAADIICFIYRPEYYKIDYFEDDSPTKDAAEIIISKNRNGALKDIRMKFVSRYTRFEDFIINDYDANLVPNVDFSEPKNDNDTPF